MNAFLAQIDIGRSHMVQCNGGYVGKLNHTKKIKIVMDPPNDYLCTICSIKWNFSQSESLISLAVILNFQINEIHK
jgi:hypothetical protein